MSHRESLNVRSFDRTNAHTKAGIWHPPQGTLVESVAVFECNYAFSPDKNTILHRPLNVSDNVIFFFLNASYYLLIY